MAENIINFIIPFIIGCLVMRILQTISIGKGIYCKLYGHREKILELKEGTTTSFKRCCICHFSIPIP